MKPRTMANGNISISCSAYPNCKTAFYLPRGFKLESRGDQCPRCGEGYFKSEFDIPLGAAPPHMVGKYRSCFKCDKDMKEVCQLRISGPAQNSSNNNRQQSAARTNAQDRQPQPQPRKRKSDSFSDSSNKRLMPPPPPPPPTSGSTGVVQCNCGQPAGSRVTQKSGVNQGRSFYTCESRNCNFFQWADQAAPVAKNTTSSNATQRQPSTT